MSPPVATIGSRFHTTVNGVDVAGIPSVLPSPSFPWGSDLSWRVVRDLFKILGKINRDDKVTILVVEQNAQLALELADQAYVIETGRIVMAGNAKDIANNEDVRKSYLGY